MTDRYERIREALEGLRERCAQEVERITARRRTLAAMINNEAVKPCEVAAAIRKIDVQQYYECAAREIERLAAQLTAAQRPAAVDEAIDKARFEKAPCYLCGYNGPGYYQPDTHPCAAKYHAAQQQGGRTDG